MAAGRGFHQESESLIRQIEEHLALLRSGRGFTAARGSAAAQAAEIEEAERLAESLRRLVRETARASAADRARVRAAVHYFVTGGAPRRPANASGRFGSPLTGARNLPRRNPVRGFRPIHADVVNDILCDLGGPTEPPVAEAG